MLNVPEVLYGWYIFLRIGVKTRGLKDALNCLCIATAKAEIWQSYKGT